MANQVLRDLDAVFPGNASYQKFKWCWSTDLWALVPVLDDNGDQKYQFICPCGVDVKVHSALCEGITEAQILMEKTYMTDEFGPLASYRNMWVLCRWNPPPSRDEWRNSMGTDADYPANGRYLPVSKGGLSVVIPPRAAPEEYVPISSMVVRMMRANIEQWKIEQQNKEIKREMPRMDARGNMLEEPHKGAKFWTIKDRIKDSMLKFNPAATVGYGGKTGRGDKHKPNVHYSDRSLADPNGPLAREMEKPVQELAKELANAHRD